MAWIRTQSGDMVNTRWCSTIKVELVKQPGQELATSRKLVAKMVDGNNTYEVVLKNPITLEEQEQIFEEYLRLLRHD